MARARIYRDAQGLFYGVEYRCPCGECGLTHLTTRWQPEGEQLSPHRSATAGWGFNGDMDRPTFTPSVLTQATFKRGTVNFICHSFITDGRIQFLSDCTHKFAGQTLDLPELE